MQFYFPSKYDFCSIYWWNACRSLADSRKISPNFLAFSTDALEHFSIDVVCIASPHTTRNTSLRSRHSLSAVKVLNIDFMFIPTMTDDCSNEWMNRHLLAIVMRPSRAAHTAKTKCIKISFRPEPTRPPVDVVYHHQIEARKLLWPLN